MILAFAIIVAFALGYIAGTIHNWPCAFNRITTARAMARLRSALKEDPEYRQTWKDNLAMAVYDEFKADAEVAEGRTWISTVSNEAAERFLQQLEKEQ